MTHSKKRKITYQLMMMLSAIFVLPVSAKSFTTYETETTINTGSELSQWCKNEARAYFTGQGKDTYQWSANHQLSGNTLIVMGKIRVDNKDVAVKCTIPKGARERYGQFSLN